MISNFKLEIAKCENESEKELRDVIPRHEITRDYIHVIHVDIPWNELLTDVYFDYQ